VSTRATATIVFLGAFAIALVPLVRTGELPTAQHHLFHAFLLAVAALSGILFADASTTPQRYQGAWLVVAMISPVLAMALMWPSEYSYFDTHRFGHVGEHLGLVGLGVLTGYGGQRYARGVGWAVGIGLLLMALLCAWGYGVTPQSG
jgi:hypothetical protein